MEALAFDVELEVTEGSDRWGKPMRPYVALVRGEDEKWGLERQFVKNAIAGGFSVEPGTALWRPARVATVPLRDGVYEVVDHPQGQKRQRYYAVWAGERVQFFPLNNQEVLQAVDDPFSVWRDATVSAAENGGGASPAAKVARALAMIDEAAGRVERGELTDAEDLMMELDSVRRALEEGT